MSFQVGDRVIATPELGRARGTVVDDYSDARQQLEVMVRYDDGTIFWTHVGVLRKLDVIERIGELDR